MVEITSNTIIDKAKSFLGLRGKAIVSSRNSVYPCVIVNGDDQPIPIRPPTVANSATLKRLLTNIVPTDQTIYTVPSGKVAYLIQANLTAQAASLSYYTYFDVSATALYTTLYGSAIGYKETNYVVPFKLQAGDNIHAITVAGQTGQSCIYLWEENA